MTDPIKFVFMRFNIDPVYVDIYKNNTDCIFLGISKIKEIIDTLRLQEVGIWPVPKRILIHGMVVEVLFYVNIVEENKLRVKISTIRFKSFDTIVCLYGREPLNLEESMIFNERF